MFDFDKYREPVWPDHLKPIGEATFNKEPFDTWWAKYGDDLIHLDPRLVEQWVHRHWLYSHFSYLPLDSLRWESVLMDGEEVLRNVRRELTRQLDPEFDYEIFQGRHGADKLPTARALDAGTWDFPIVVLSTPQGLLSRGEPLTDVRLVLVEGHQRHRYLNALHAKGAPPRGPHEVFVIRSPVVDAA